jgi:hypothetical protein
LYEHANLIRKPSEPNLHGLVGPLVGGEVGIGGTSTVGTVTVGPKAKPGPIRSNGSKLAQPPASASLPQIHL